MEKIILALTLLLALNSCEKLEEEDTQTRCAEHASYISDYYNPAEFSEYEPIEVSIESLIAFEEIREVKNAGKIYIKDDILIIGEGTEGFHIYDNSNPSNPIAIKFLKIGGASDISIRDDYFYINQYQDLVTLKVNLQTCTFKETGREKEVFAFYNYESKKSPDGYYFYPSPGKEIVGFTKKENFEKPNFDQTIGTHRFEDCPDFENNRVDVLFSDSSNDGQGGSLARFILKGDYLYVVDQFKLSSFLISEDSIANPIFANSVKVGFSIETLFSLDNNLFIGSQFGMFIYNIDTPETPKFVSEAQHFRACDPVISNGKYAFVTVHSNATCGGSLNELFVYDIEKDITKPELIVEKTLIEPKGLTLYKDYLIVADNAIRVFDTSSLATKELSLVSKESVDINDFILRDNHLFAIGDLGIYQYTLSELDGALNFELISQILF